MEKGELILKFEVPQYLREIEVSSKQRPKYYYWDGTTIKAKGKKLLQKYINSSFRTSIIVNDGNVAPNQLKYPYFIAAVIKTGKVIGLRGYKGELDSRYKQSIHLNFFRGLTEKQSKSKFEEILINIETKERVIANTTQAGKPKRIIIKGQDMYSGVLNEFTRAKIVKELKDSYDRVISFYHLNELHQNTNFPFYIELEIVDTIRNYYDNTKDGDGRRWDVGNRAYPYLKTFTDFLVERAAIPDDDRLHVAGEGYYFTPCNTHEERKLIFRIYKI